MPDCFSKSEVTDFLNFMKMPDGTSVVSATTWALSPTSPSGMTTPEQSASTRMCCGRTKPICWQIMLRVSEYER